MLTQTPATAGKDDLSWLQIAARSRSLIALAIATLGLVGLFWPTAVSAVHLWDTSSTYTYAYLVAPISIYLIWADRQALALMFPRATFLGVLVVGFFAAFWFISDILAINVGRHIALVGMFQGLCLCVLGRGVYRRIIFALNYLWLMVPTGEFLLWPLQKVAHVGAVALLQLSGIPVFAEGLHIQVPQGGFIVEPGCAGLNFLLAALALSLLYGKVLYRSISARVLCVIVALGFSIVANIVRIYLIIALTEWTDQRIGLADDHLLFGWGFFSVVMLALMWIGARTTQVDAPAGQLPRRATNELPTPNNRRILVVAVALLVAAAGPALSAWLSTAEVTVVSSASLPQQLGPWTQDNRKVSEGLPRVVAGDAALQAIYVADSGAEVQVAITIYHHQREGHEAASAINGPGDGVVWHVQESKVQEVQIANRNVSIAAVVLQAGARRRNALFWYEAEDCITYSRLLSKLCRASQQLLGRTTAGAFVVLSTQQGADQTIADAALLDLAQRLPAFAAPRSAVSKQD